MQFMSVFKHRPMVFCIQAFSIHRPKTNANTASEDDDLDALVDFRGRADRFDSRSFHRQVSGRLHGCEGCAITAGSPHTHQEQRRAKLASRSTRLFYFACRAAAAASVEGGTRPFSRR